MERYTALSQSNEVVYGGRAGIRTRIRKKNVPCGHRQWQVFMLLVNKGDNKSYREIAKAFDLTKEMVCCITCRLAKKGLIERYSTGKGKACQLTAWGKTFSDPLKSEGWI